MALPPKTRRGRKTRCGKTRQDTEREEGTGGERHDQTREKDVRKIQGWRGEIHPHRAQHAVASRDSSACGKSQAAENKMTKERRNGPASRLETKSWGY